VDHLQGEAIAWEIAKGERKYARGSKNALSFSDAIARFTGDLLRAKRDAALQDTETTDRVYRSLNKVTFTAEPVSFRLFNAARKALVGLGYVEHIGGKTRYLNPFGDRKYTQKGTASRFVASPKLLTLAGAKGIQVEQIDAHFHLEPPAYPLILSAFRTRSAWGHKSPGERLEITHTPVTDALAEQVRTINTFLSHHRIEGGVHFGFVRGFNMGDIEGFDWKWGGRLYSIGSTNYQQDPGDKRALMKIDGEPVVEIDVSASYLTAFHARLKEPFDTTKDPYARISAPRDVAKTWTTISFGTGAALQKWSRDVMDEFAKRHDGADLNKIWPAAKVSEAALEAYPAVSRLGEPGATWADLMFHESEAIIATMNHLMNMGVPSLPVHDSIIVPLKDAEQATGLLFDYYLERVGLPPRLKTTSKLKGAQAAVKKAWTKNMNEYAEWHL
jgi:hypothetical protein